MNHQSSASYECFTVVEAKLRLEYWKKSFMKDVEAFHLLTIMGKNDILLA